MKKKQLPEYDVVIVGGGPAGLSGALLLGRCRRRVIVFDEGFPRNQFARQMNGFITRDGINPTEFLFKARQDLLKYNINVICRKIVKASFDNGMFISTDSEGNEYVSKKILLATGIRDILPPLNGIENFYGTSVFHCPYCDGWENRDKKIVVLGRKKGGKGLAYSLLNWSDDITLLLNGKDDLSTEDRKKLKRLNIKVVPDKVVGVKGEHGRLHSVILENEKEVEAEAMFFSYGHRQQSNLASQLNCEFTRKGVVKTDKLQETNIPGCYVVGDASRDMQFVIVAASEGTKAGVAINTSLTKSSQKV